MPKRNTKRMKGGGLLTSLLGITKPVAPEAVPAHSTPSPTSDANVPDDVKVDAAPVPETPTESWWSKMFTKKPPPVKMNGGKTNKSKRKSKRRRSRSKSKSKKRR